VHQHRRAAHRGEAGREHVRARFLYVREASDYLAVFVRLLDTG
jgi:hypothetical protein